MPVSVPIRRSDSSSPPALLAAFFFPAATASGGRRLRGRPPFFPAFSSRSDCITATAAAG